MKGFQHFESPHLGLLKSAASFALSGISKTDDLSKAIDSNHAMMQGVDRYGNAFVKGESVPAPVASKDASDPEVAAYLAQLFHHKAHARINQNKKIEADLDKQLKAFTYGNPLWQHMFTEYIKYYWQYPFHKGEAPHYRSWEDPKYGNGNAEYGVIDWRLPAKCRIALIGDIGTGTDIAAGVITSALSFKPHAFLHLGDVYYSGTAFEFAHRYTGLFETVFKALKQKVPVFGVPGNHEYFTGAISYLENLDSNRLVQHSSQMQSASYFCLRTEDDGWQFLGMDTGFYGHYMDIPAKAQAIAFKKLHLENVQSPALTAHWDENTNPHFYKIMDPTTPPKFVHLREDEKKWHQDKMDNFSGRTFLHSHHQLYSAKQTIGQPQVSQAGAKDAGSIQRPWINTELWQQLNPWFEQSVAAWIWGHEHNLGIFKNNYRPEDWPASIKANQKTLNTLSHGRCAGHSAIPVAEKETPYEAKWPVPLENSDAKLDLTAGWYNRGFQIITLQGKNKPAIIHYYQISGADPKPILVFEEEIC